MKIPIIKVRNKKEDIICSITYNNKTVKAGYKKDGTVFVLSGDIVQTSIDFIRIGCAMWDAVLKKHNVNPGIALESNLIDLKYCKQMQFAQIVGYDLGNMAYNKKKSNRNIIKFFEENLK